MDSCTGLMGALLLVLVDLFVLIRLIVIGIHILSSCCDNSHLEPPARAGLLLVTLSLNKLGDGIHCEIFTCAELLYFVDRSIVHRDVDV